MVTQSRLVDHGDDHGGQGDGHHDHDDDYGDHVDHDHHGNHDSLINHISFHCTILQGHKVILSACSPYFKKILRDNPCRHPVLILNDMELEVATSHKISFS